MLAMRLSIRELLYGFRRLPGRMGRKQIPFKSSAVSVLLFVLYRVAGMQSEGVRAFSFYHFMTFRDEFW